MNKFIKEGCHEKPMPNALEGTGRVSTSESVSAEFVEEGARRFTEMGMRWKEGGVSREEVKRLVQFGRQLGTLRRERGINIEILAERTHLDKDFLIFLETGLASSNEVQEVLGKLSEGLGVNPSDIASALSDSSRTLRGDPQTLPER
jgi:hypothetical protein